MVLLWIAYGDEASSRRFGERPAATRLRLAEGVNVWSGPDQQYYPLFCDVGDGVVDWGDAGGEDVRFTQTDVAAYTTSQTATYLASGNLGLAG